MDALTTVTVPHQNHTGRVSDARRRRRRTDHDITEEEINRYIAKKAIKSANKMNDKFVWRKKIEHDVSRGVPLQDFTLNAERKKQRERMEEVEKIKTRREQRGAEKAQRDEQVALFARECARSEADGFERKEREFELSQCKIRSAMRLSGGRGKAIDVLTTYVDGSSEFVTSGDPCGVFKGLSVSEIEGLREEIKMYVDLDRVSAIRVEYWEAVLVVCDWELAGSRGSLGGGIHPRVEQDVRKSLGGRSYEELVALQCQVESDMRSGRAKEVEFWGEVVRILPVYKAKAFLKENYAVKLRKGGSFSPKLLDGDEAEGVVVDCEDDKYRPRKPKYINRVHTGYRWNKYNRIHYDHDNPPPKFVQGYKFNIFYPDLVDKSTSPCYFIEEDEGSTETCIIRFHAGPPYEDIVFRIVNNEWEKGFKGTYDGGILKLHFNFKRFSYRR